MATQSDYRTTADHLNSAWSQAERASVQARLAHGPESEAFRLASAACDLLQDAACANHTDAAAQYGTDLADRLYQ